MKHTRIALFYFFLLAGLLTDAHAQGGDPLQVSEEQVNIESKLIEAVGLANQDNPEGALEIYLELLRKDPGLSAAAFAAGRLHQQLGQQDQAVRLMQQAYRSEPDNLFIGQALAEVLAQADRHLLAADVYGNLFAAHPGREEYLLRQSQSLAQAGKAAEGLKVIQNYLVKGGRLSPNLGQQRYTMAVAMNDQKLAIRVLEDLLAAFPGNPEYYQELAQFYQRTGNEEAARSIWQRMAERFPDDERAALGLAGQGKLSNEEQDYISRLAPIFEDAQIPIDNKVLQLLPVVQELVDRNDTVLANRVLPLIQTLTRAHPEEAKAFALYGDVFQALNRHDDAVAAFRQTLVLDKSVFLVWEKLMESLEKSGDFKGMLKDSERALVLFPNQATLYYYNGQALAHSGDFAAAESSLRQGEMLAMDDQVLRYDLAEALAQLMMRRQQYDQALSEIDRALVIRPKHGPALALRAEILLRQGKESEAMIPLQQASKESPSHPYVMCVEALGRVMKAEVSQAQDLLDAAAGFGADRLSIFHETAGDIAFLQGKEQEARAAWERATEIGGGSSKLAEKLSQGVYVK